MDSCAPCGHPEEAHPGGTDCVVGSCDCDELVLV